MILSPLGSLISNSVGLIKFHNIPILFLPLQADSGLRCFKFYGLFAYIHKKSVRVCTCYSSRSSRRLALPITKERATLTPTPNMYILTIWAYILKNISMTVISTYPYGHLLLLLSCWCLKFARLRRTKDKASSKRLFQYMYSPTLHCAGRNLRRGRHGKDTKLLRLAARFTQNIFGNLRK